MFTVMLPGVSLPYYPCMVVVHTIDHDHFDLSGGVPTDAENSASI